MKIVTYHLNNLDIEIIEIKGEFTGRGAIRLSEYLYTSLDEGAYYKIINLKHVIKADGLWLQVVEYFISRGMHIRLFNAGLEMQNLLKLSGKEDIIKTYNCQDCDEVVSLFEKEILEEKGATRDYVKRRRHSRVNVSFPKKFHYHSGHNGEIHGKAHVLNLSESGLFADRIMTINKKTGEIVNNPEIAGRELHELRFELNGTSKLIETRGECVWEAKQNERLSAGIRFMDMRQEHKEMIREYVVKSKTIMS